MLSPLAGLCEVLKEVKRRIRDYSPTSEAQTRMALIDPVLTALGWNLSDPSQVELEKNISSKVACDRLDYVLKAKDNEFIVVEAKKLGEKLKDHERQIIVYAITGSKGLILTNGSEWRYYKNTPATAENPNSLMNLQMEFSFDLSTIELNALPEVAANLVQYVDATLHTTFVDEENELFELKARTTKLEHSIRQTKPYENKDVDNPREDYEQPTPPWCILTDNSWEPKGKRPIQLWLPGKKIVDVTGWGHVLTSVCEYCLTMKTGLLNPLPIPDRAGRKTSLVSITRPMNNCSVIEIEGQTLYVNTNYDASTSIRNAVYMLEKLGEGTASKAAVLLAE